MISSTQDPLQRILVVAPSWIGDAILSQSLLTRLAKSAGLPWDVILSAETARAYKPLPEAYTRNAQLLNLKPEQMMLVAAHNGDLAAASAVGYRTAFVVRPGEYGSAQTKDLKAERAEVKRATTVLGRMRSDGNEYRVEFFETYGEARQFKEQAEAKLGAGFEVNQSIKDQYLKSVDATSEASASRRSFSALPKWSGCEWVTTTVWTCFTFAPT